MREYRSYTEAAHRKGKRVPGNARRKNDPCYLLDIVLLQSKATQSLINGLSFPLLASHFETISAFPGVSEDLVQHDFNWIIRDCHSARYNDVGLTSLLQLNFNRSYLTLIIFSEKLYSLDPTFNTLTLCHPDEVANHTIPDSGTSPVPTAACVFQDIVICFHIPRMHPLIAPKRRDKKKMGGGINSAWCCDNEAISASNGDCSQYTEHDSIREDRDRAAKIRQ